MSGLSPLARTVVRALSSLPIGTPEFDVELVRAALDTDEATASTVLSELVRHDLVVAHQVGRYTITDSTAITGEGESPDTDAAEAVITWFVDLAVAADRARDRFSRKLSRAYGNISLPKFCTPADAMFWYTRHHAWFVALLDDLLDRKWYELSITLAEAVVGLAGHSGHQQDQVHAAKQALHALNSVYSNPESVAGYEDDDDRARQHDLRVARFNLMLAAALTNLREYDEALQALEEAEQRGRATADVRVLAAVGRSRGRLHHAAGDLSEAERELRDALVLDEGIGDLRLIALCRRRLGTVLSSLRRYNDAGVQFHGAAVATLELGDRIGNARVLTESGAMFIAANEPEKAIAPLTTALDTMKREEAGSDAYLADIYRNLAHARRATKDLPAAEQCFRKAVEHYRLARRYTTAADLEAEWNAQL